MNKRPGLFFVFPFVLFFLALSLTFGLAAQSPARQNPYIQDEVILRFRAGIDEYNKVLTHYRVGGTRARVFNSVEGLEVIKLPPGLSVQKAIDYYQRLPHVLYAEPNYILRTTVIPNDPRFGDLWGLNNTGQSRGTPGADIDAPEAWNITKGSSSVVVAVVDTGIDYNHQDLAANISPFGFNAINNAARPVDDQGHGTHVSGTIGAIGNNNIGVVGVNWTVSLVPCKFLDAGGSGTVEGAIACLDYVKNLKDSGVNIVATSNSWGGGDFSQALLDAIHDQRQHGILFIAAAGNGDDFGIGLDNDTTPLYPCSFYLPNIVCVAATTRRDALASFSNFGRRTVHIGAPGNDILSTLPGNTYGSLSGTSMATPHVSGVAALLKAQNPNRDWKAIKNLILAGGDNKSSTANTITGKRLNARGAMTCVNSVVLSRLRPVGNTIGSPGIPLDLSALHINCASPNGAVDVTVSPGGEIVTLLDNGLQSDPEAGDGIYSGQWIPSAVGTYTLTFPGNDSVTVNVANPTISLSPSLLDFGNVPVGNSSDQDFTVQNSGGGVLKGNASTNPPYLIVSGGSYSLSAGQSQTVTVRFSPTSLGTFPGNVNFTGGDGTSATLSGNGIGVSSITPNSIDLATPASFTVAGYGFTNSGFGLPVINFTRSGTVLAQAR